MIECVRTFSAYSKIKYNFSTLLYSSILLAIILVYGVLNYKSQTVKLQVETQRRTADKSREKIKTRLEVELVNRMKQQQLGLVGLFCSTMSLRWFPSFSLFVFLSFIVINIIYVVSLRNYFDILFTSKILTLPLLLPLL